jgi:drug/metabolite transporter (DMT)-like permease
VSGSNGLELEAEDSLSRIPATGLREGLLINQWKEAETNPMKINLPIIYILASVLLGAIGQIMLKKGMTNMGPVTLTLKELPTTLLRMGTNPFVIIGLAIYVSGTVFWLAALSRVNLSYAYPFASLSYVVMLAAAWLLFSENITPIRLLGTLIVGLGVILISRS